MLGPLHTYVLPAVRQRAPLPPLPAKAPRAIRSYQVDASFFLRDAGTTIDHAVVLPGPGLVVGNISWVGATVAFALGGGAPGGPDPSLTLTLILADKQREDWSLVQPIRATLPDVPDDALSIGGQLLTLGANPLEVGKLPSLAGGAQPGDTLIALRAGVPGLVSAVSGGSSGLVTLTAGATLSGHRVLMPTPAGTVVHADPSNAGYQFAGISTQAVVAGAPVLVGQAGALIVEPSWAWTPGAALYVAAGGLLTTIPPTSGISQQVAVATAATTILVQPFVPFRLS